MRYAAYALIPAEFVLVVCLVAGVRVPAPVLAVVEVTVVLLIAAEAVAYRRLRRRGSPPGTRSGGWCRSPCCG